MEIKDHFRRIQNNRVFWIVLFWIGFLVGYAVPYRSLEAFSPSGIEINELEIPIGRSYKSLVLKKLDYTD